METSEEYRAFWRRMAERYKQELAKATTDEKRTEWQKRVDKAEAKANPKVPLT